MSKNHVAAVLLAAGSSTRLGEPKQFLRHRGETLLRHTASAASSAGCDPVVVVTGAEHARIVEELSGLDLHFCAHPEWERGIGSSLRAGLQRTLVIQPECEALLVLVCDQPFITAQLLAKIIAARARTGRRIAAAAYAATLGVPALFTRTLFPELAALADHHGAKQLIAARAAEVVPVPFPLGAIDIDTPAEREKYLRVR